MRFSLRNAAFASIVVLAAGTARDARAAEPDTHWTAATPDAMIDRAAAAAQNGGPDALARVLLISSLADEASAGKARAALAAIAKGKGPIAEQARWLARMLEPEPQPAPMAGAPVVEGPTVDGMIRTYSVLGPFEDTGGGLARAEGPETPAHDFRKANYSWGVYQVRPVRSAIGSATAD